jgi:hypothetical protein
MLGIYELPGEGGAGYPKEFAVDYVRGYRFSPRAGGARS